MLPGGLKGDEMSEHVLEKQRRAILIPIREAQIAALGMWETMLALKFPLDKDIETVMDLLSEAERVLDTLGDERTLPDADPPA